MMGMGMGVGMLVMLLCIALALGAVALVVWLVVRTAAPPDNDGRPTARAHDAAVAELRRQFAAGEIDREEYLDRLYVLSPR